MERNQATILVNSCDTYEDAWYPFFELLKKYWNDCPYKIVLNTETKTYTDEDLDIECYSLYQDKKPAYGERMLEHLKRIDSDFIIMMLDDFFLRSPVDEGKIDAYLEFMEANPDVAYIAFDSVKDPFNTDDGALKECLLRPKYGEYKVNLQGGIWSKAALFRYIRKHESPWEFETKGSIRSFERNDCFYCLKDLSLSPMDYGKKQGLTWGIVRGKWVQEDVEPLFREHGIECDLTKRGFFDKNDFVDITISKVDNKIGKRCMSYGPCLAFRMDCWRVNRMIRKILRLSYDIDWVAYKRRKEYQNGEYK